LRRFSLSRRLSKKWVILMLLLGLSISSGIAYLGFSASAPLNDVSNLFYDTYQKQTASGNPASHVLIVDIDDISLDAIGQWPWPRYKVAELIQAIAQMNPSAIGLDIIFPEEDRTALMNIRKAFKDDFDLEINFAGIPPSLTDNDGYLGSVLSETGTVGANYFYFDHASKVDVSAIPPFEFKGRTDLLKVNEASGLLDNTYKISSQLRYTGFVNVQPDDDGMLRRMPLLIRYQGVLYPHLALATFMRSQGENSASVEEAEFGLIIQVGSYRIPLTEEGFALLRFHGLSHLYPSISARDLLNGTVSEELIRDKLIFIGSSAAGLKDLHHTVFDAQFPGVKTLAVMAENFSEGNTVIEPLWSGPAMIAGCMVTGALISLLFVFVSNALLVLGVTIFWGSCVLAGSFGAFNYAGLFLTPAPAVTTILLLLTLFSAIRFAIEKKSSSICFRQLAEARRMVNETLDETEIARKMVAAACDLLGCRSGAVGFFRHGEIIFSEYIQGNEIRAVDFRFSTGHGVSGHVLQARHTYVSNDAEHDKHVVPEIRQELDFRRLINVPVLDSEGGLLACLEIYDRLDGAEFETLDVEILESLSGIAASALVNARLLGNIQRNEKEIAAAAERLNRILDADFDAVIVHQNFRVIYANKAARKMFDSPSVEQGLGMNPLDYVSEPYRDKAMLAVKAAVRRGRSFAPVEIEALRPQSGVPFPIEVASTAIVWGDRPAVVSIVRDITARKAREEGMRLLESAVASISESVVITDPDGVIVYVNPSCMINTGYSRQEMLGSRADILNSPQQDHEFYNRLWKTVKAGELWSGRILNRKKDGSIYPVHISASPIFDVKGEITHFVVVYGDLSEYETLQEKMMQSQKMEAVGTLVGGLAHDFNNMLASMVGNLYLMGADHEDDEVLMERIRSMEGSVQHAANMIKQMLTFARKDMPEKHVLDMKSFVLEAYKLALAALPENISFQFNAPLDESLRVKADATQLQQVLLNLVTNARHAVEGVEKPEIVLELDREPPSAELLAQNLEIERGSAWCRICCRDNGCGISSEILERVFEPFFTTKGIGEGTGLGLAMVYGAIRSHHGMIDVESAPGLGTAVTIWLPLSREDAATVAVKERFSLDNDNKSVLLVDDEVELRSILAEVLSHSGFLVLQASDGEQAVEVFRKHQLEVDLVLMDVVMPNRGGVSAAEDIRELDALVPILFQTGYGEKTQLEAVASITHSDALQKPVQVSVLLKKMAEMIG